jgi:hypothetical protein
MTTQMPTKDTATMTFTRAQSRALRTLRRRYQQDHDLFSAQELARLRFIRWLYLTGGLAP